MALKLFFCFALLFAVVIAVEKNAPKSTVENERVKKAVVIPTPTVQARSSRGKDFGKINSSQQLADAVYGYNNYYNGVYGNGLYNGAYYGYPYGYLAYGSYDDGKYRPGKYDDGKYHPGKYDDGKYYPGKYEKTATLATEVYKTDNNGYNYGYTGYNYPYNNYGYNAYYGYIGYPNAYYPYNGYYNKYYHNNHYLRSSYPYVY